MKFPTFIALLLLSTAVHAGLTVKKIADGFNRPVWAGDPGTKANTLWIMEQHGHVHEVNASTGEKKPLFYLSERVSRKGNEEGMLGLAFAPDFAQSGAFYINYTDKEHYTCISRFRQSKLGIDVANEEIILRFKQDFENHNGGWIDFGPDGMLYIGNGDGGSGNDPNQRAQDLQSLLGKILRLDVTGKKSYTIPKDNPFSSGDSVSADGEKARPEIWAYGLRNPWRCSFDQTTDELWIADVGQNRVEEVNVIDRKTSAAANFGWRLREGDIATPTAKVGGKKPKNSIDPVYVYQHGSQKNQGFSVTGGYVYRGKAIPELQGRYVFADYANPRIWSIQRNKDKSVHFLDHTTELQPEGDKIKKIPSFAKDRAGELYIIDHTGPVYKIVPKP